MSKYYNAQRTRNMFDPNSDKPFKISRSKLDLFLNCPRCFYIDRRLGVGQPPGYPFNLNSAVDNLLKNEFDTYRKSKKPHPYMVDAGIDAIPHEHENLDDWRDSLRKGIQFLHSTNLLITGGIDDLWINPKGEFIIVDYKATSKNGEVSLDADWQIGYKRQMEIYQWLFRQNGFKVSSTGYFVYCNGNRNKGSFNNKLEFDIKVLPYHGDDSWVDQTVSDAFSCLTSEEIPTHDDNCDYCCYQKAMDLILN